MLMTRLKGSLHFEVRFFRAWSIYFFTLDFTKNGWYLWGYPFDFPCFGGIVRSSISDAIMQSRRLASPEFNLAKEIVVKIAGCCVEELTVV